MPPCFDEGLLEGVLRQRPFAHVDQAQAENIVPVLIDELLDLHLITSLLLPEPARLIPFTYTDAGCFNLRLS